MNNKIFLFGEDDGSLQCNSGLCALEKVSNLTTFSLCRQTLEERIKDLFKKKKNYAQ